MRVEFSTAILSTSGLNLGAFSVPGGFAVALITSGANWIELQMDGDTLPGNIATIAPPTGLVFSGGGDVALSSVEIS